MANFRFTLARHILKTVTAYVLERGNFWDDLGTVWGIGTGCCGGSALSEKETFTVSVCESEEHELVAV